MKCRKWNKTCLRSESLRHEAGFKLKAAALWEAGPSPKWELLMLSSFWTKRSLLWGHRPRKQENPTYFQKVSLTLASSSSVWLDSVSQRTHGSLRSECKLFSCAQVCCSPASQGRTHVLAHYQRDPYLWLEGSWLCRSFSVWHLNILGLEVRTELSPGP